MARILMSALSALSGGAQTYINNITPFFPSGSHSLDVLSAIAPELPLNASNVNWIKAPGWTKNPILRALLGPLYFRVQLRKMGPYDAYFFVGGTPDLIAPGASTSIIVFHNMAPFDLKLRRQYKFDWQKLRLWLLYHLSLRAFNRADLLIFISEHAKSVIDELLPERSGDDRIIYHGATTTTGRMDQSLLGKLPERFVLYLSAFFPYKAQLELVEAWALVKKKFPGPEKLVLAGPESEKAYAKKVRRTIRKLGRDEDVVLLGPIKQAEVSDLISRALFNVFPSTCENCPNIMLEIMHAGNPVIASSIAPMPEIGGPALDYFDPYNKEQFADLMIVYMSDADRRNAKAAEARRRVDNFKWEETAGETWSAIIECCQKCD